MNWGGATGELEEEAIDELMGCAVSDLEKRATDE